jgi:cytochrome c-type biogenesis protein
MSLSFIRGLVAAVNPCGFILLPTYLMYFLGLSTSTAGTQRATIRRALLVSAAVSAGFMTVFLVAGLIAHFFTSWVTENSKYATGFIGVALIVLGIAMLFGYKPSFLTPNLNVGEKDKTIWSMFIYGIAYAVASIGCTIGLFIATLFSTTKTDGVVSGVGNMVVYGLGMALLVSALTVALAVANTGLLKFLRKSLAFVDRISAAFVVLSGLYLLWYFYWVDLENPLGVTAFGNRTLSATFDGRTIARSSSDPINDWVSGRQSDVNQILSENWPIVALVFLSIVGAAVAYVPSKVWRDAAVVAAIGVASTVALFLVNGTDVWRLGLVTAVSCLGAVAAVRSADGRLTAEGSSEADGRAVVDEGGDGNGGAGHGGDVDADDGGSNSLGDGATRAAADESALA